LPNNIFRNKPSLTFLSPSLFQITTKSTPIDPKQFLNFSLVEVDKVTDDYFPPDLAPAEGKVATLCPLKANLADIQAPLVSPSNYDSEMGDEEDTDDLLANIVDIPPPVPPIIDDDSETEDEDDIFGHAAPGVPPYPAGAPDDPGFKQSLVDNKHGIPMSFTSLRPKRLVNSARQSPPLLQKYGLQQIYNHIQQKGYYQDTPCFYGCQDHYNRIRCWGAASLESMIGFGVRYFTTSSANTTPMEDAIPFFDYVAVSAYVPPANKVPLAPLPPFDFNRYKFRKRISDKVLWPPPNPNIVSTKHSLAELLTTGYVCQLLAAEAIIPVVVMPDRKDKKEVVKVIIGPLLDQCGMPIKPGTCYAASEMYDMFGLKKKKDHHDTWAHDLWLLNCLIFRLPGKNALPVVCEINEGMAPLGEVMRVLENFFVVGMAAQQNGRSDGRKGCQFFGSGANGVVSGANPSDPKKNDVRESATFETYQTIKNKLNSVIVLVCEKRTPLVVIVAGPIFPKQFHDKTLAQQIGEDTEQAMYLGCYQSSWCAQDEPLEKKDLVQMIRYYAEFYSDMDTASLRYLLEGGKRFHLTPLSYDRKPGGYRHLEVHVDDPRKPTFVVPTDKALKDVFDIGVEDDLPLLCSERKLARDWVEQKGYLELLHDPYVVDAAVVPVADQESILRPMDLLGAGGAVEWDPAYAMAIVSSRQQTFDEHWHNLKKASVAAFCRTLAVNLDVEGKIGPLIDYNQQYHFGGSLLTNYIELFGSGLNVAEPIYMTFLGPGLQKSPTTHPIRVYDAKCLLLMLSNGGAGARLLRPGLTFLISNVEESSNLFFHCILVEVVKVHVLMEWSRCYKNGDNKQLPLVSDIPCFLAFIAGVMRAHGEVATNGYRQEQYDIHPNFDQKSMFFQFFLYLHTEFEPWLRVQIAWLENSQFPDDFDLFYEFNMRLSSFLGADRGIGSVFSKQAFHTQHMLMNVNEVFDLFPIGRPRKTVSGYGGEFGAKLLSNSGYHPTKYKKGEKTNATVRYSGVMASLLDSYKQQSDSDLKVLGLYFIPETDINEIEEYNTNDEDEEKEKVTIRRQGELIVIANGRPLTVCDVEHCCCVQYILVERDIGGGKGLSRTPQTHFTYCQPIRTLDIVSQQAEESVLHFKELVDDKLWLPDDDQDEGDDGKGDDRKGDDGKVDDGKGNDDDDDEEDNNDTDTEDEFSQEALVLGSTNNTSHEDEDLDKNDSSTDDEVDEDQDEAKPRKKLKPNNSTFRQDQSPYPHEDMLDVVSQQTEVAVLHYKELADVSRLNHDQCDLMLGMIFGDLHGTTEEIGNMRMFSTQLRRDTARCHVTELAVSKSVYTMDNRTGDRPRKDRHIQMDMSVIDLEHPLLCQISGTVSQICLDHFWWSAGYWNEQACTPNFFLESLPKLRSLLVPSGCIYLCLSTQMLVALSIERVPLSKIFHIGLVHSSSVGENDLVKGSHSIPDEVYAEEKSFGRKSMDPEIFLGTKRSHILQTTNNTLGPDDIAKWFLKLVYVENIKAGAPGRESGSYKFISLRRKETTSMRIT
jgi:hypothetical protein